MESLKSHLDISSDNFTVENDFFSNWNDVILRVLGKFDDFIVLSPV